ncbi:MAG: protein kinase [Polyangiaceae bacterium]|nr:protein kinase [Polyangiaceae bacterium]MCW5792246.1 protein kinase [Polyangiaceae bacterium]
MKPGSLVVDKYVLKRRLAQGGMGEVWSAWHRYTHRDFAIKFLLPELARHQEALGRFLQEAEATGQLQHPSIVEVYDVGQAEDGRPFLVMELLSGESLEQRLTREAVLDSLEVTLIFSQVAQALRLTHERGIVHRDLSTANIFLAAQPQGAPIPKLLDFGVSKNLGPRYDGQIRTGSGAILGSPDYMSPEQASGAAEVDARTDIWALGVQMYECLAGAAPFRASNYNALMIDIMTREPRPLVEAAPGVDPALASLVMACLVKDREARIGSAEKLAEELERLAIEYTEQLGLERPGPRRRATDRLSINAEPPRSTLLPRVSTLPRGSVVPGTVGAPSGALTSAANTAQERAVVERVTSLLASRPMIGLAGAALGTWIGVVVATGGAAPTPTTEAPLTSNTHTPSGAEARFERGEVGGPEVTPLGDPTDLVEAVTRGLGIDDSLRPRAPVSRPSTPKAAPRKKPKRDQQAPAKVIPRESERGSIARSR